MVQIVSVSKVVFRSMCLLCGCLISHGFGDFTRLGFVMYGLLQTLLHKDHVSRFGYRW